MVMMDFVGLVVGFVILGLMFLMMSPVILLFIHINRKVWRMMTPLKAQAKHGAAEERCFESNDLKHAQMGCSNRLRN